MISKQSTQKNPEPSGLNRFQILETGSETGLRRKVLGNVTSAK